MIELSTVQQALQEWAHIMIIDADGIILNINNKFVNTFGYHPQEVEGKPYQQVFTDCPLIVKKKEIKIALDRDNQWQGINQKKAKSGMTYVEAITIIPYNLSNHYLLVGVGVPNNTINEYNDFHTMIKHLENTVFKYIRTDDGRMVFTFSEGRIAEKIGFVTEVVQHREVKVFFPDDIWPVMKKNFADALIGETINFEMHLFGTDFLVYLSPIIKAGQVLEVVGTALDITERKKHEALIHYMAYHDSLTGLVNRAAFGEELIAAVQNGKNQPFAVLFLDLDRFKNINDTLGHRIGDHLLKSVAERLKKLVKKTDIVARLGGDEYAMILFDQDESQVTTVAEHIVEQFSNPFLLEYHELYTMPSIGISLFPQDGRDADVLLNNADMAMYHIKENPMNHYAFFTKSLSDELKEKKSLEIELKRAIKNEEFMLYYQPQINMKTGEVFGVEALIRWQHPEKGLIFPGDFIPTAEETGLIIPIGEWVLCEASKQNKAWQIAGYSPVVISVNVAPQQFMKRDFINIVRQVLSETQLAPKYLELEITESATVDIHTTQRLLTSLEDLGVKVSIDDFGTGYSSLNYLSQLSINKLKIDQSFIRGMDTKNEAIVKTIISLAKNLNIAVIAEGVEMAEHVDFLMEQQCHQAQGYLFSKPLPENQLLAYFSARQRSK